MIDTAEEHALLAYEIISSIAIFLNLIVIYQIFVRYIRIQSSYVLFLLILHVSVLGDTITALPFVFNFSDGWCLANQSFKFYFGLMNVLIIALLIQGNRILLMKQTQRVTQTVRYFIYLLIVAFPCIAFLPYSDNKYELNRHNPWCTKTYEHEDVWSICVQYGWAMMLMLINGITNIVITYNLWYKKYNPVLMEKFLKNIAIYSCIAALSWIPRFVSIYYIRMPDDDDNSNTFVRLHLNQYFPMNVAGILFAVVFLINRKMLLSMERSKSSLSDTMTFSVDDVSEIIDSIPDRSLSGRSWGKKLFKSNLLRLSGLSNNPSDCGDDRSSKGQDIDDTDDNPLDIEGNIGKKVSHKKSKNSSQQKTLFSSFFGNSGEPSADDADGPKKKRIVSANREGIDLANFSVYDNPLYNGNQSK